MYSIAVIGANGFVGSKICQFINLCSNLSLIPVVRGDDLSNAIEHSDIVIHSANPSKRFYAKNHPDEDYLESVEKTRLIAKCAKKKRLILVSSISARSEPHSVYGKNRRQCELIAQSTNTLIIRLGPMFGEGKSVGAIDDLLKNKTVFVAESTKYAYVNVDYNAKKIVSLAQDFSNKGIIELGSKKRISLSELKKITGSNSTFEGRDDTQIPINPPLDAPNVKDVMDYLNSIIVK